MTHNLVQFDMPAINNGYSFKRLAFLRSKIKDKLIASYSHVIMTGEHISWLVSDLCSVLPKVREGVMRQSLEGLIGQEMNEEIQNNLCFRLSGNLKRLQARKPVRRWIGQTADEWLPCYVMQAKPHTTKSRNDGHIFLFKIMAGQPAGMTVEQFWSRKFCAYMGSRYGFSNKFTGEDSPTMFVNGGQFVLLRFSLLFTRESCADIPRFSEVKVPAPASLVKWNKEIIKRRCRRASGFQCDQPLDLACQHCPVGYLACANGTHRLDYEVAECSQCQDSEALFDPDLSRLKCVNCLSQVKSRYQQKESVQDGHANACK